MDDSASEESPAQRQARLRREKRNARLQTEGADRLARISQLTGRSMPKDDVPTPATAARPLPTQASNNADDPAEVDISEHHWTPQSRAVQPLDGFGFEPRSADMQNDPMMQVMQQMMGGAPLPATGADSAGADELPSLLRAMLGGQQQTPGTTVAGSAYLWRIIHALSALSLAIYIGLSTAFDGTRMARLQPATTSRVPPPFYMFGTVELILQTSRYLMEKGQLSGKGWIATIANSGLVPEPWAGYVRLVGRYSVIWQTIVADAMTVVFVLGAIVWWRGAVAAA